MTRNWTQDEISDWKVSRDKKRIKQGLPPFDKLDANQKQAALEAQRVELFQSTQLALRSTAWSLGNYPLPIHPAPRSGTLELPRHYLSAFGCDRVSHLQNTHYLRFTDCCQLKFQQGDNLNLLTYRYYDEVVNPQSYSGSNFVTDGSIQPKRSVYRCSS